MLLDVTMPDLDGFETLRRIREAPATATAARAHAHRECGADDRTRAESLGADDFIAKPFEPADVVARVRALLGARGLNRDPKEETRCPECARSRTTAATPS